MFSFFQTRVLLYDTFCSTFFANTKTLLITHIRGGGGGDDFKSINTQLHVHGLRARSSQVISVTFSFGFTWFVSRSLFTTTAGGGSKGTFGKTSGPRDDGAQRTKAAATAAVESGPTVVVPVKYHRRIRIVPTRGRECVGFLKFPHGHGRNMWRRRRRL